MLVLAVAALGLARADSWPGAQVREVFSASRDHFVRVTPGDSWGDTVGFAGAKKGQFATATFFRRADDGSYQPTAQVTLRNPVAPVEFFVANDGRLATIDNWHNRGYGDAVAIYGANGMLVKAYGLADLFSPAEIEAFSHSVSSIHWHEGPAYINVDQATLLITLKSGDDLSIGLASGRFAVCETRKKVYRCRQANDGRAWMAYGAVRF
jgi:hypothetical protein